MVYCNRLTVCFLLVLAGCRTHPQVSAHIDSVNAEYRQLEDYVYALEEENGRLQQELDYLRQRATIPDRSRPPRGSGDDVLPPRSRSEPETPRPGIPPLRPESAPAIEPEIEFPRSSRSAPALPSNHSSTLQRSGFEAAEEAALPSDTHVTHLFLNPLLTGGMNFDDQPGDDGLCIVVEPRNAGDEYVPQTGALSVVVLDPNRQGEAARVARWDFDRSSTPPARGASSSPRGIKLEVPWPASPPTSKRLRLFVRYETVDGRRLEAEREVFVTPPGQLTHRWTPRSAERQRTSLAAPSTAIPSAATAQTTSVSAESAVAQTQFEPAPGALSDDSAGVASAPGAWSPYR